MSPWKQHLLSTLLKVAEKKDDGYVTSVSRSLYTHRSDSLHISLKEDYQWLCIIETTLYMNLSSYGVHNSLTRTDC